MRKKTLQFKISEKIKKLEKKFNSLPRHLKITTGLYLFLVTFFLGTLLGISVNAQNLQEINKYQREKTALEQNGLNEILNHLND